MKKTAAKIELLTPDLDTSIRFIPGYDLQDANCSKPNKTQIAAIALALLELTALDSKLANSNWVVSQKIVNFEGSSQ
jgi:hypothetical protein